MEAFELVRVVVNKTVVSTETARRGNPGYSRLHAVRLLVYARLKRIGSDMGLIRHLKKNRKAAKALGFKQVSHRTTVGRWWRHYPEHLKEVFELLVELLKQPLPCKVVVVDSSPLEDKRDPEGRWVHFPRIIQWLQAPRSRQPERLTNEGFGDTWQQVRLTLSSRAYPRLDSGKSCG